ncbi:hypothetical protein OBBRIDRAFT_520921 [Obba rivulosa]|uniref:Uncharacterized protein n=1 Tax=Obba rivulosa TaxID=1052685 RepID=A0A8E2DFD3_9APHY|nr:hypothetical protein OBBRIDRAFT_520921 [Obba rivulosa]
MGAPYRLMRCTKEGEEGRGASWGSWATAEGSRNVDGALWGAHMVGIRWSEGRGRRTCSSGRPTKKVVYSTGTSPGLLEDVRMRKKGRGTWLLGSTAHAAWGFLCRCRLRGRSGERVAAGDALSCQWVLRYHTGTVRTHIPPLFVTLLLRF